MKKNFLLKLLTVILVLSSIVCFAIGCGEPPHAHVYDQTIVDKEYLESPADCNNAALYYYSCTCGAKGNETFEYGEALGHSYTNYKYNNDAKCEVDGTETATCDHGCGEDDTRTKENSAIGHAYGEWISNNNGTHTQTCANDNKHKITKDCNGGTATCTEKAICKDCGVMYGGTLNHTYDQTIVDEKYLESPADCNNAALYYYSCTCGAKGNETFEYGGLQAHDYKTLKFDNDNHWYECECGDKSAEEEHKGGQATCTKLAKCSVCLKEYGGLQAHDYKTLKFDNDNHWYECECGDKSAEEEHEYLNGRCEECDSIDPTYMTEGLKFNLINNDTEYEVSGYTGTSTEVYIPSLYNGKPVTSICDYAFLQNEKITSIEIPNSVTSVGTGAFAYCSSLTSVIIGSNVTTINPTIFAWCSSLTSVTVNNGNTKYHSKNNCIIETGTNTLIVGCKTSIIPNYVTSIGEFAFACSSLTSIIIPDSVTSIGDSAFDNCSSLTSVTFGENSQLTSIGERAFNYCHSLTSIEIPNSVTSIGSSAFYRCNSLTSVTIGDSVTSIGDKAFYSCDSLTSIIIPDSVTSIGDSAFDNCSSLTIYCEAESQPNGWSELWNPDNRPVVWADNEGEGNDGEDEGNEEVGTEGLVYTLINGDTEYSVTGYAGSSTNVVIPSTYQGKPVTSIGYGAFAYCSSLTNIVIPNSVISMDDGAFLSCNILQYNIEGNLKYLGNSENPYLYLAGTTSNDIASVTINANCKFIGVDAFYGVSLTSIEIPNSVTSISGWQFYGCSILKYNIEGNLKYLGNSENPYLYLARTTSNDITSATINANCKFIGIYAFSRCTSLTSVEIGNSVISIGWEAFSGCTSLTSIEIPKSVTSISEAAFYNCTSLTGIMVVESNQNYKSVGGNLYSKNGTVLIQYAIGKTDTEFIIPNSVTSIGAGAFAYCSSLTNIVIPNSVRSIGEGAFGDCTSLKCIKFNGTVDEWNSVSKGINWDGGVATTYVECIDGNVPLQVNS